MEGKRWAAPDRAFLAGIGLIPILAACAVQFSGMGWSLLLTRMATIGCLLLPLGMTAIRPTRGILAGAAAVLLFYWFAGFDTPYYWDGVLSAVRARVLWETGGIERFSIFYLVLAPFVGPTSSVVPGNLLCMLFGVVAIALAGWATRPVAGRTAAFFVMLIAPLLAPVYILYHHLMIDTLLVLLWTATLAATMRWGRDLTPRRLAALLVLVMLTAATKEMGILVLAPVSAGLIVLARRRHRRPRLLIIGALLLAGGVIGALVLARYAQVKGIESFFDGVIESGQGLTFLPFNPDLPQPWWTYLKIIARQHLTLWFLTGLPVILIYTLLRPRDPRAGWMLLVAGGLAQAWILIVCRPEQWTNVYSYPLFDGNLTGRLLAPNLLFLALAAGLWMTGRMQWRMDRRMLVPLLGVLTPTLFLHLFVKAYREPGADMLHVWQAWHYMPLVIMSGVLMLGPGLRRVMRLAMPPPARCFLRVVLAITLLGGLMHSVSMTACFRRDAQARAAAYALLVQRPERTVYTHWPFSYVGSVYATTDVGPLRWKSDGWTVLPIETLHDPAFVPAPGSLLLWDDFHGYGLPMESLNAARPLIEVAVPHWRTAILRWNVRETRTRRVVGAEEPGS